MYTLIKIGTEYVVVRAGHEDLDSRLVARAQRKAPLDTIRDAARKADAAFKTLKDILAGDEDRLDACLAAIDDVLDGSHIAITTGAAYVANWFRGEFEERRVMVLNRYADLTGRN